MTNHTVLYQKLTETKTDTPPLSKPIKIFSEADIYQVERCDWGIQHYRKLQDHA